MARLLNLEVALWSALNFMVYERVLVYFCLWYLFSAVCRLASPRLACDSHLLVFMREPSAWKPQNSIMCVKPWRRIVVAFFRELAAEFVFQAAIFLLFFFIQMTLSHVMALHVVGVPIFSELLIIVKKYIFGFCALVKMAN